MRSKESKVVETSAERTRKLQNGRGSSRHDENTIIPFGLAVCLIKHALSFVTLLCSVRLERRRLLSWRWQHQKELRFADAETLPVNGQREANDSQSELFLPETVACPHTWNSDISHSRRLSLSPLGAQLAPPKMLITSMILTGADRQPKAAKHRDSHGFDPSHPLM